MYLGDGEHRITETGQEQWSPGTFPTHYEPESAAFVGRRINAAQNIACTVMVLAVTSAEYPRADAEQFLYGVS